MTRYCVDADVLIEALSGNSAATELLQELLADGPICVSAIAAYEVTNVPGRRRRDVAIDALGVLDILPVDGIVALAASRLAIDLRTAGRDVPLADLLIAATCLLHGLTLVTRNAKHFGRIRGLKTVSW